VHPVPNSSTVSNRGSCVDDRRFMHKVRQRDALVLQRQRDTTAVARR
jgi:hypothetical protein